MQQTPNYDFKKIDLADSPPDITVESPNWDTLDTKLKEIEDEAAAHLAETAAHSETITKNFYVRKDGNDANNGLTDTAAGAFLTITKALSVVRKLFAKDINININIAPGVYAESVIVESFNGAGMLNILGSQAITDTHIVNKMVISGCNNVYIRGFKSIQTNDHAFVIGRSNCFIEHCKVDEVDEVYGGIYILDSIATVQNSFVSNRRYGILAARASIVLSNNNSGTGNIEALNSSGASTIGKSGTQPSGTTMEASYMGGVIR